MDELIKISSSVDVQRIMKAQLQDLHHEEFWILLLNRANKVMHKLLISKGGLAGTVVDTKIIFKKAIDKLSSSIILVHNHPSGNNKPSHADIEITKKLVQAGKLLDVSVLDHIIIARDKYYSFSDENML